RTAHTPRGPPAGGPPGRPPPGGGGGEVIEDRVNGRLVPPDDPRALADALADLLVMPGAGRQRLATAARQTIAEAFDPLVTIQKLEACFGLTHFLY
ncbi:MAG: hypothetical protein FWH21_08215, partial [Kiritimatiellaeota bacterium]|nr:hypothetical protein [Kiritimatiellota bacterium]